MGWVKRLQFSWLYGWVKLIWDTNLDRIIHWCSPCEKLRLVHAPGKQVRTGFQRFFYWLTRSHYSYQEIYPTKINNQHAVVRNLIFKKYIRVVIWDQIWTWDMTYQVSWSRFMYLWSSLCIHEFWNGCLAFWWCQHSMSGALLLSTSHHIF